MIAGVLGAAENRGVKVCATPHPPSPPTPPTGLWTCETVKGSILRKSNQQRWRFSQMFHEEHPGAWNASINPRTSAQPTPTS